MKKIVAVIMTIAVLATLGVVALAEGASDPDDNGAPEPSDTPTEPEPSENDNSGKIDALISAISEGAFWTTVAGALGLMCACVYIFKRKFDAVTSKLDKSATAASIGKEAEAIKKDIKEDTAKQFGEIHEDLRSIIEILEKLFTTFVIFEESTKINPNAKKEIMEYVTGIKKVSGTVFENVSSAIETIKEAVEAEPKIETPVTDAAIAESEPAPTMLLG